jgi:hypothetical protein
VEGEPFRLLRRVGIGGLSSSAETPLARKLAEAKFVPRRSAGGAVDLGVTRLFERGPALRLLGLLDELPPFLDG